ncbi:MAG: TonB-dependent siderophore receptor [Woeseia sp.]
MQPSRPGAAIGRRSILSGALVLTLIIGALPAQAQEAATAGPNATIDEVVVTGRAQTFYRVEETSFATKTSTSVLNVPQSVQILTRQLIEDQAARDTTDLYRSISGMTFFSYSGVTFRGFRQDEIRYDGVRGDPFAGFAVPQLFAIERIEVLKGVSGMLYGSGEPGGIINYVTKKPEFDGYSGLIELTGGSRSLQGIAAEATGPLSWGRGDEYAFRLGGLYEKEDSFRNNAGRESAILDGGLSWQPGGDTRITGQVHYYDVELPGNRLRGVPVDDAGNFLTSVHWNTNEATDFLRMDALIGLLAVEHQFTPDFGANVKLRYVDNEESQQYHESRGAAAPGSTLYLREFSDQTRSNEEISLVADFVLQRAIADAEHTILFGAEAYQQDGSFAGRTARQSNPLDPDASLGPVQPLDLLDPVYGNSGIDVIRDVLQPIPFRRSGTKARRYGGYVQDQVRLSDRWQLIGGARFDAYEDEDPLSGASTSDEALSLRGGVIFKPVDWISSYVSYGEGFLPQGVLDPADGGPFGPQETRQVELGVKSELFGGRIFGGLSVYEIIKDGVLIANPDSNAGTGGIPNLLQIGEVTSRGFELDFVGDFTELWTFQANYAHNDARITGGGPGNVGFSIGDRFANAPRHEFGFWTRHEIPALNSAIAGGIDYVAERISINGQRVRPHTIADLSWITELDAWKFQLNVRNLFDEEYAASGFIERTGHFPGEPRTVVVQVSRNF